MANSSFTMFVRKYPCLGPFAYILLSSTAFEEEKRQNFEVVADMTRQHKTMREELLIKINTLEEKCTQLQDKVGAARLWAYTVVSICTTSLD